MIITDKQLDELSARVAQAIWSEQSVTAKDYMSTYEDVRASLVGPFSEDEKWENNDAFFRFTGGVTLYAAAEKSDYGKTQLVCKIGAVKDTVRFDLPTFELVERND